MADSNYYAVMLTYDRVGPDNRGIEAPQFNSPSYVERQYLNLDGMEGIDVGTYRMMDSVRPVGCVTDTAQPITIAWGATDYSGGSFDYGPDLAFDGIGELTDKLDHEAYGRWLAMRIEYSGNASFVLSGMDVNIVALGDR